ncbi:hypothetical protein FRC20_001122 [Serendipita sp. 405]|nr:hypothetical protein FRC15_002390 [Serendipita sp. 397]KAG8784356.1 hypothetical protein FRC16_002180 [Serendipita sp. 398]KAG8853977.1 hypothetical protein FRC20_001122 [Serendipita sp. 405]
MSFLRRRYGQSHDIRIATRRPEWRSNIADPDSESRALFESARTYEQQFDQHGQIDDLNNAITKQKAGLESSSPFGFGFTVERASHRRELAKMYKRRFDWGNQIRDLDEAITNYEAGKIDFLRDPTAYFERATVYELRFVREDRISDLDHAIENQKTGLRHGIPPSADGFFKLAHLQKQRFDWGDDTLDLEDGITSQKTALQLLSNLNLQKPIHFFELARLYDLLFDRGGRSSDIRNAVTSQKVGLELLPDGDANKRSRLCDLKRMRTKLTEAPKELLLEDLRQLSTYIRKPKSGIDIVDLMEGMIDILKESDADMLCSAIRDHSLRLGTYCEALRSQMGGSTDRSHLQTLYNEIVTTEKELSAAHKNLTAKYERMYKVWREKREQISNMLLLLDSVNLASDTEGIRTQMQKVDEGFKQIRKTLDDQGRTLKDYFDTCKALVASNNSKGNSPSGSVPPDNPGSTINPPESRPNPSDLPKVIRVGKEILFQVAIVVGKARYTKTRRVTEEGLSDTASKLEKLCRKSQKYESKVLGLSLFAPHQANWWNLWREPSYLLPNLVKKMNNRLNNIQKGFDKYKQSILGLIFRPLGDMIEDLKPYLSQAGQEVVAKRLHPDMILYEAAFLFLIKSSSRPLGLAEHIDEYKSRLEGILGRD